MRILQCIAGFGKSAGGPSVSVPALCGAIAEDGHDVTLTSLLPRPGDHLAPVPDTVELVLHSPTPLLPRKLGASRDLKRWLGDHISSYDIVHCHGLWMQPSCYAAASARKHALPFVSATRGMLEPWSLRHKWLRKRIFWHWAHKRALQQAACIHATCDAELESIRRVGLTNPVAVVPNGVDAGLLTSSPDTTRVKETWPGLDGRRVLLFLSRVHPKKGLLNLAEAWRKVAVDSDNWVCVVAGPDQAGHTSEVKSAFGEKYAERGSVLFPGPVYGELKHALMARADVFVLPTFSENFGIVVAEALAAGTPVITTKGAPWQELETHRCGWWIDIGVEPLRGLT